MKNLFPFMFFFLTSSQTFAQFDYRIFKSYSDKTMKQQSSKIVSVTEFLLKDKDHPIKTGYQEFNAEGLPVKIVQFSERDTNMEEKVFFYTPQLQISNIETYKNKKHEGSTEFKLNVAGQIASYTEYVYSSLDGKKMIMWETFIEYYPDQIIKKTIKTEGDRKDTSEVNFYNNTGELERSLWKMPGLRTTQIKYIWNKDKTEMKEDHYENDSTKYSTVIHRYKNNKEVERIDPSITRKPFYWKYDTGGRITETNEAYYYVSYYTYDSNGRTIDKTINILFSDSSENDLPKKLHYKYEYKLRD